MSALNLGADAIPYAARDLFDSLQFRIYTAETAAKRAHWVGGRLYNVLTGQSGTYVPLYGTHLRQSLQVVLGHIPEGIEPAGEYELRLDYAKRALVAIKDQLEAQQ